MRNSIVVLSLFFAISSCQVEGEKTKDTVSTPVEMPTTGLQYSGTFVSSPGESVSGSVKIFSNNENQLFLENVITNGPDLKVYLSKTDKPTDFVNLGSFLKSKTVYDIPAGIDISSYKYIIIYCQQYSVSFGVAQLNKV